VTREHIYSVVIKHLVDAVDDLDIATIDPAMSMKDMGANSLDIVEVVSRTMRELKIKVPRSELSKLSNLDGLVDLLYQVSLGQQASA
jgi:polyketide biosynthesis acyl carrier protein